MIEQVYPLTSALTPTTGTAGEALSIEGEREQELATQPATSPAPQKNTPRRILRGVFEFQTTCDRRLELTPTPRQFAEGTRCVRDHWKHAIRLVCRINLV